MKNLIKAILAAILLSASFIIAQDSGMTKNNAGKFILSVAGFNSDEGKAMIALFNSEEDYSETGNNYKSIALEIKEQKCEWLIEELPFGEYAIKLFHDENGNGKMDRNMIGIPSEDYAFSNNAAGNFGPADYEDAKFLFNEFGQSQKIIINE
jgi:uncharacterized protein (DUF2141 family)